MTEAIDLMLSVRMCQSIPSKFGICLSCPIMLGGAKEHENHRKLAH